MTRPVVERRPKAEARGWVEVTVPAMLRLDRSVLAASAWFREKVTVLSTLTLADYPAGRGVGTQWHVSVARGIKRAKPAEVAAALRAFGMAGAEEDNHHPGAARHFWLPVDPAHRVACECKATETTIVDPRDGYTWTNPTEGPCRGCEFAAVLGRPCPIHRGAA